MEMKKTGVFIGKEKIARYECIETRDKWLAIRDWNCIS